PIVGSPVDALFGLGTSGIDVLVLEDFLLDRRALPEGWGEILAAWQPDTGSPFARERTVLGESLYTFV
ncbi:MAG TPA: hypothetical protein VFE33_26250, partial [Thermoanaerobaculia bacterium]|nr:hypothetical protein [Thermoanaerobaculia bacterium]